MGKSQPLQFLKGKDQIRLTTADDRGIYFLAIADVTRDGPTPLGLTVGLILFHVKAATHGHL